MEVIVEKEKKWINSTVVGIGIASFFSDVGHEMATAALPALLSTLGAGAPVLGLIEGLSDGLSSAAKLFSGHYSDRLEKRKPLAVIGYFCTASGMASFAFATQTWHVLLGRVGGWMGRGARTPVRNTLLVEATTPETYGRAIGLERSMDSAGAIFGPLIASFLVLTIGLRLTFLSTLIPGILAALCIAYLVKEKPHTPSPGITISSGLSSLPNDYRKFLWAVGIAGLGDFSNTLLILWATQSWIPLYGVTKAGSLAMAFYVGFNVVYTITCYVGGAIADRVPKKYVLTIGYIVAAIPAVLLAMPGAGLLKFAGIFGLSGLYMGIWETVETSIAASILPSHIRGIGFGALATVNGIGDLISSIVVGLLWVFSPKFAMSYVVLTCLIGAILVTRIKSGRNIT
jgi:MFS family permease